MNQPVQQTVDELTGLMTRKAFLETLDGLLEKAKGSDAPLSLAFIDIDHFLTINDQYGHSTGDDVLRALAVLISEAAGNDG